MLESKDQFAGRSAKSAEDVGSQQMYDKKIITYAGIAREAWPRRCP